MTPNLRKNILLGGLGFIVLLYAGDWLMKNVLEGPLQERNRKIERLDEDIKKKETALARARQAGKQLEIWEAQSLPSDSEVARSLYRAWLLELVVYVDLGNPFVDSGEPLVKKGMYRTISFSVRGRGTLDQLTTFLFYFYDANHLHQIRSLAITPVPKSDELDLSITIEAVVLPTADRRDRLSADTSDRLAFNDPEDYESISGRNLFGIGGNPDPTDYTFLTTVVYVDSQPEAWFTLPWFTLPPNDNPLRKFREGQTLEIGQFSGTIAEIADSDVIIESEGERWLLTIGENLAQAFALPPEF